MKILFVSFEDSFERNIISYLSKFSEVQVSHFKDVMQFVGIPFNAVVFGPGPGHVEEYLVAVDFIEVLYKKKVPLIGICLGHQLILHTLFNGAVVKSDTPAHGKRVKLIDQYGSLVQRYNSWTVKLNESDDSSLVYDENGELAIYVSSRVLTMQFHPESVGTNCPNQYFQKIHSFIVHNDNDEIESKWTLQS
ncbi:aminodeoxychorismate/anthranilate synthase component II [Bacteriovorax sp. Seq25_V]|uniref:aminodeoxychorismate/anthranilate synthase component II n=1 Tax=Bacteriovorax sp. Seq25_V TaxID=1201288 RepID=UPI00038A13F0|nr:aminodeoxychorismate/anthranilate synthase component II [Bacteriovorax sp. Seq25_V]EQC44173.1 class I glutamine amidotransferase [Bacteriovorax sp. Seq25_V]